MSRDFHEADEFFVNLSLNTEMELPTARDTVLHFFEQMKKAFPDLAHFFIREGGDLVLEGDKDKPSYRWITIEPRRLAAGHVNPPSLDDAYHLHETLLELAPHLLTISPLDCEALDVTYGFDLNYAGNHDEIVAEALGVGHALESLIDPPSYRILNFEPSITLALEDSCRLQCRLSLETRTSAYHIRTGDFPDEPISVHFAVRQYWGNGPGISFLDSFRNQRQIGEQLLVSRVVPRVIKPLARAIASR
ncbi:MAG: hypothetical protein KatS3mg108_2514 [Isosphaeraceae bacterium]|jgi:hypothetical protein|nr:MAG: hypothetical protein KatS3mg108_2514 [Isosphaeraceae bacterium]